ncbi:replication initiator protein A [Staphylococcus aureus]|nr:replication initiator protein A [Staphylococcus aureus]
MQLSNDAKIAYALLKDRLELSIKNNWLMKMAIYFSSSQTRNLKIY